MSRWGAFTNLTSKLALNFENRYSARAMKGKKTLLLVTLLCFAGLCSWYLLAPKRAPFVIVILLDTLRADHLSTYGHHHVTSPELDAFGKEAIVFSNAFSTAPWTPPSVASLFTGLYATAHGMTPSKDKILARETGFQLQDQNRTMAEYFRDAGFATAGISANPWISEEFGFSQGFDAYSVIRKGTAKMVTDAAMSQTEKFLGSGKPSFLYLQYIDPHHPYSPPAEFRKLFPAQGRDATLSEDLQKKIRLYDGEIRYLDKELGRLFAYLKSKELFDDAVIVITADHGEQFMDHGEVGHGLMLFNSETHVPLYVKPNLRTTGERVETPVSVVDILPTVLELTGIRPTAPLSGVSLMNRKAVEMRDGVMSEVSRTYFQRSFVGTDGRKLIQTAENEEGLQNGTLKVLGVFDAVREPAEVVPLQDETRLLELKISMDQAFKESLTLRPKGNAGPKKTMSQESLEQLKSLGYIQ